MTRMVAVGVACGLLTGAAATMNGGEIPVDCYEFATSHFVRWTEANRRAVSFAESVQSSRKTFDGTAIVMKPKDLRESIAAFQAYEDAIDAHNAFRDCVFDWEEGN